MQRPEVEMPIRQIYLLQRKTTPLGIGLGKTSGWVHRAQLKNMLFVCFVVCSKSGD
jgi:2,4-dienoyl-CoA reductase (NADPH2)